MPNGLNDPEDPLQAGWAGYHQRAMCPDSLTVAWTSWQEPVRSISVGYKTRFYPDELNDFMARMQWADEGRGNRNPVVVVNGDKGLNPLPVQARAGDSIRLDAVLSSDPDGDDLTFNWWQQPEIGTATLGISISTAARQGDVALIKIPDDAAPTTCHAICEVHDNGLFHLVSYRRIIIQVVM